MAESAYYIFKWPNTLTMLSHFWNKSLSRFQGRVNYTPKPRPKINPSRNIPAWLLRYELICWERIGQKAVDMPRVHRLSLTKPLNGSYKARVERRTKYSWEAETNQGLSNERFSIVSLCSEFVGFKPMTSFVFNLGLSAKKVVFRECSIMRKKVQSLMTLLQNLFTRLKFTAMFVKRRRFSSEAISN